MDAGNVLDYESKRNSDRGLVSRAERVDKPLREMIVQDQIRKHTQPIPLFPTGRGTAGIPSRRTWIASLLLGSKATRTTWSEAFRVAFEMTVEEFYLLFEEHRAAGFPGGRDAHLGQQVGTGRCHSIVEGSIDEE